MRGSTVLTAHKYIQIMLNLLDTGMAVKGEVCVVSSHKVWLPVTVGAIKYSAMGRT